MPSPTPDDTTPNDSLPQRSSPLGAFASWLATGLGIGLKMPAPGTFGALWGIPIWLLVLQIPGQAWQIGALALFFLLGIPVCTLAARDLFRRGLTTKEKDPGSIVWDEFATVPMVYAAAPAATATMISTGNIATGALWLAIGFGLHRLFDITKPWPCRQLEKLPDGLGIMIDDLAAAFYAGIVYWGLWHFFGAAN